MKVIAGTFPGKVRSHQKIKREKVNLLEHLPHMVTAKIRRIRIVW